MHQRLAASVAAATLIFTAGVAAADEQRGFAEAVIGVGIPLGEEDYEDVVDPGLKAGVRAGASNGVEIGADYTDLGGVSVLATDVTFARYRAMAGFRHRIPAGKGGKSTVFFRGAAGVDVVQAHAVTEILGNTAENDETDVGLAVELGGGFQAAFGNVFVGAHFAVPIAFHFDDDDPDDDQDFDLEYTSYDLDLLFTVGVNL